MSWLRNLLEILQIVTTVVSFIVLVVEVIYEGISKAGEQKKKEALANWEQVKPLVRKAVEEVLGSKWVEMFDKVFTTSVVSVLIDLLVLLFNRKGFFPKSNGA